MNVNDNVYVIPFDKLDEWYKEENSRLGILESDWRALEGKRGIVAEVSEIDNTALVFFPAVLMMLYFYEDTLEKIPFGQEE